MDFQTAETNCDNCYGKVLCVEIGWGSDRTYWLCLSCIDAIGDKLEAEQQAGELLALDDLLTED